MPDWGEPVLRYILEEGLPGTLRVAAIALTGSVLIGVVLGTLITIRFLPLRAVIRSYIEVFRGLPILVTVFIVYFGLGEVHPIPREQHEAASALGFGWVGRHVNVVLPQALRRLLPPAVGLLANIIQNTTLAQVIGG